MEIKTFFATDFPENCYAGITEDGIFLVDPGEFTSELKNFVLKHCEEIKYILLTHRHIDHIGATAAVAKLCQNAKIVIHSLDAVGLTDFDASLANYFGLPQTAVSPHILCKDNDVLHLGKTKITVWHTAGHTVGSVCYLVGDVLFCGDLIFRQSCGRVDFPTGNPKEMMLSLKKLCDFSGELILYPGHMETTTLSAELSDNPYLRGIF